MSADIDIEQMDTFEGEGSGLELVHLSDVLDYLGDFFKSLNLFA